MLFVLGLGAEAFDIDGTFFIPLEYTPLRIINIEKGGAGGRQPAQDMFSLTSFCKVCFLQVVLFLSRHGIGTTSRHGFGTRVAGLWIVDRWVARLWVAD